METRQLTNKRIVVAVIFPTYVEATAHFMCIIKPSINEYNYCLNMLYREMCTTKLCDPKGLLQIHYWLINLFYYLINDKTLLPIYLVGNSFPYSHGRETLIPVRSDIHTNKDE